MVGWSQTNRLVDGGGFENPPSTVLMGQPQDICQAQIGDLETASCARPGYIHVLFVPNKRGFDELNPYIFPANFTNGSISESARLTDSVQKSSLVKSTPRCFFATSSLVILPVSASKAR